jgi:hypothetical protein
MLMSVPVRRRARRTLLAVALVGGLVATIPAAHASPSADGPVARYIVSGTVPAGTTALADYGGAALVDLSAAQAAALRRAGVDLEALPDTTLLKLNRTVIDTTKALPTLPAGLRAPAAPTSWVLQMVGPAAPGWLDTIAATGMHPVTYGYVPENGWLVRGDAASAARAAALPFVQAIVPYAPAFRLSPRLDNLVGTQAVRIVLFGDADLPATAAKLAGLGATELGRIDAPDFKLLHVRLNAAVLQAVARLDTVQWIEPALELKLDNDHAADTLGVRPVWDGIAEAPTTHFTGQGEIAAIADTGIDTGNPATIHPDFKDHIVDIQTWGRPGPGGSIHGGDASDEEGHGTHTTGSVAGDGTAWGQIDLNGCKLSCVKAKSPSGMAPDAGIVFQSISAADGSLAGVPEDPGVLYGAAYDAGARVHSNSYGSDAAGEYDAQAMLLDRFMASHPDMLITFSAGNAGTDANANGIIDFGSIGSPATAKDTLSVGASEDQRGKAFTSGSLGPAPLYSTYAVFYVPPAGPPIENDTMSDNREGMVAFSSRGPTADGRLKPDVVGIGTHVLSTRSTLLTTAQVQTNYWGLASEGSSIGQPTAGDYPKSADAYYAFDGGTSMSNPLVAGTAVDVRQYLRQVRGFASPSAALLKAALTSGAHELQGQYDALHPDVTARPDDNEGWGRVDVANTIDPTGGTKAAYYDDPVGLRTGGTARYTFNVTNSTAPIRVQLAWTDAPANLTAAKTLVNDLDLVVTAPNGTVYRGNEFNARSGGSTPSKPNPTVGNHVDNVEGVQVLAPAPGTWTVDVKGFTVPSAPQKYALVFRGGITTPPTGAVHLDAPAYKSGGRRVQIVVNDPKASGASVRTTVATTSAPAGVTVKLSKVSGQVGVYKGQVAIGQPGSAASSSSVPGKDGDAITVTYIDAADASHGAAAVVDNRAPVVSGVVTQAVTPFSMTARMHADEAAAGGIDAATTPTASFSASATDPALVLDHVITVPGLNGGKRYYYRAIATDDPGNVGVNDNGGNRYTFRTPLATTEYSYDAETAAGWTHAVNPNATSPAPDLWHLTQRADAVHGGTSAWLYGPEDPNSTYADNSDAFLDSPAINRAAASWSSLEVWANYDTEKGFDGLNFFASDNGGSSYKLLPIVSIGGATPPSLAAAQIDGNSGGYRLLTFDLSQFTGPTLKLRIEFYSDTGVTFGGAAVDDLVVHGSQPAPVAVHSTIVKVAKTAKRGATPTLGRVTITPARDWARLTGLTVHRTGTATDADVPSAVVHVGTTKYTSAFVNGVATFPAVLVDTGAAAPAQFDVDVVVAPNASTGRTVGLNVTNLGYAAPDTAVIVALTTKLVTIS